MSLLKFLVFVGFCLLKVDCMALKGPALTRYDPCGLGVIHFDKFSKHHWVGAVHLGLYKHLKAVEIEITFQRKVKISGASHNSTMIPRDDKGLGYLIKPKYVPKEYVFYLELEGLAENDTDVPTVTKFSMNGVILCDDSIKASQTVESLNVTKEHDKYDSHVCGRRSLDHTELVSVRTEARAGDWPWHVAILTRNPETNVTSYYCGGNIISRTAIVTAGHCTRKGGVTIPTSAITVVAGVSNHRDINQEGRQSLPVLEVILHPNYDDGFATSDVAVLKVNRFTYTAYVQPICIWGPVYDKANLVGRQATVVGFGRDENNRPSDVLRSTYIRVQNDSTCINYSPSIYGELINEFTLCAGYGPTSGINPRNGDSGGGLVLPVMQTDHKVSWFLRGVLSKCGVAPGHTECDPKYYVVYTDIGPHYGWIYHHSGLKFRTNVVRNAS